MSILIRGMEIPENCFDCPCRDFEFHECRAKEHLSLQKDEYGAEVGDIPEWCPLVEVPPHGRLGDLDDILNHLENTEYKGAIKRILMQAPTIIEAEKEE